VEAGCSPSFSILLRDDCPSGSHLLADLSDPVQLLLVEVVDDRHLAETVDKVGSATGRTLLPAALRETSLMGGSGIAGAPLCHRV
jgi:hypothetical protein